MSQNIRLLDCTLRDGGYINDWEFGNDTLTSVFERLINADVDIVEVGFLDDRRPFDADRSIFPDTESVSKIYGHIEKKNAMVVGMIDFGTCKIEQLQPCSESYLDGIRVIFKKEKKGAALAFCKQVKALGYKVFVQAVSITSYNDQELQELVVDVNEVHPFALSIVDTYGLLHQSNLMHVFKVCNMQLLKDITIGYHAHNNFQMGYANCISILAANTERTITVDGSLYGMGKSAGNAPLELIAMHMNEVYHTNYDISQMLEAIEINIMPIFQQIPWGYNLFYYLAASHKCHPSYVSYLLNMHTLSIRSITEILVDIEESKKLNYDVKYIEQLYLKYQQNDCADDQAMETLSGKLGGRRVLILGPGKTIGEHTEAIQQYIANEKPVVIAINFIPSNLKLDYLFLSNAKRYVGLYSQLFSQENKGMPIIATSNVTKTSDRFDYVLNYSSLIDASTEIPDNSLVMLLRALARMQVQSVALAGLDGYRKDTVNYYVTNMEYSFAKEKAEYLNGYVKNYLKEHYQEIELSFITHSMYEV